MYLFVRSSDPCSPRFLARDQPGRYDCGDVVFTEVVVDGNVFLGFYDWLRTSSGQVVGVSLILHDDRQHIVRALLEGQFGEWDGPEIMSILFRADAEIDWERSGGQEFSVSRCYMGSDGAVALLFDASEIVPAPGSAWEAGAAVVKFY